MLNTRGLWLYCCCLLAWCVYIGCGVENVIIRRQWTPGCKRWASKAAKPSIELSPEEIRQQNCRLYFAHFGDTHTIPFYLYFGRLFDQFVRYCTIWRLPVLATACTCMENREVHWVSKELHSIVARGCMCWQFLGNHVVTDTWLAFS